MKKLHWIIGGLFAGALYSWLVTVTLERSLAFAWPEWYAGFAEGNERTALFLWNAGVVWLPCLLLALAIGFALIRFVRGAAFEAAVFGAVLSLLYSLTGSQARDILSVLLDFNTLVVVTLLPLGVLLLQRHRKPLDPNASDAGAG
ncbi:hypothetical protein F3N42_04765 [Marinihelvus fidelis]|uniref:Uncharacterized protein n=1 Tax=Marinihelvus fidelis TaxID=2613842 RepID=A0A5N0TGY0_9GAMM|nr:hypothetical protein [Marinihelvus fidelis]KAA9132539.1 hypothetical protein F3N42_04765 [Marinihelvus fidelis]